MQIDLSFLIIGVLFFLRIMSWLIIIRVVMSWIAPRSHHPFVLFVAQTTEPLIAPVRRWLPKGSGTMAMIDWSPLIALILVDVARYAVIRLFA